MLFTVRFGAQIANERRDSSVNNGFIVTERTFMTSKPGLFVAGDVRAGSTKQAASAAGEGATAALMVREYLKEVG